MAKTKKQTGKDLYTFVPSTTLPLSMAKKSKLVKATIAFQTQKVDRQLKLF